MPCWVGCKSLGYLNASAFHSGHTPVLTPHPHPVPHNPSLLSSTSSSQKLIVSPASAQRFQEGSA